MPEDGPLPTDFIFNDVALTSPLTHSELITGFDPIFEMELSYFDYEAVFYQPISVPDQSVTEVLVDLIYQACDDKLCIFRDEQLVVSLSGDSQQQQSEDLTALTPASEKKLKIQLKNTDLLAASTAQDTGLLLPFMDLFLLMALWKFDCTAYICVFPINPSLFPSLPSRVTPKDKG